MLSGLAPKLDIAARITSMSPNRGAATVRVRYSISYVDGARAVHRGHSRRITRQKERRRAAITPLNADSVVQRVSILPTFTGRPKLLVILAIHASGALRVGPVIPGRGDHAPTTSDLR
jgi:hypothetical protein